MDQVAAEVVVGARVSVTGSTTANGYRIHLIEAWGVVKSQSGDRLEVQLDADDEVVTVAKADCALLRDGEKETPAGF